MREHRRFPWVASGRSRRREGARELMTQVTRPREAGVRPTLLVSYTGTLGGGERILLDYASGLARPALLACPEGPLAAAARELGLGLAPLRERPIELRASARRRLAAALGIAGLAR